MTLLALGTASVEVQVQGQELARALASAITVAVETTAIPSALEVPLRIVRLRTRRRFDALGPDAIAGAVAVVRVTEGNARRLPALVEAIRAAGALGVQLLWDGESPPRAKVEQPVFAVLEQARATRSGPPVFLARTGELAPVLRRAIVQRGQRGSR